MPGDKSISHRALIIAACAFGKTKINGLLESQDVIATMKCLQSLGVHIVKASNENKNNDCQNNDYYVYGAGIDALQEPKNVLDCGNSGTSARLLAGLIASRKFNAIINGDQSLRKRPMDRLFEYLKPLGVQPRLRDKKFLPLSLGGIQTPLPLQCTLQSPSAQIKTALLLFALAARGVSRISEPYPSRDHSERMLLLFQANLKIETRQTGQTGEKNSSEIDSPISKHRVLVIEGGKALIPPDAINIPGDISSAAFFILAATICKDSEICLRQVGVNPTRMGFVQTLLEMGADIQITPIKNTQNDKLQNNTDLEPIADIRVKYAQLNGVTVPRERAASMIDEYPALAIAAACAKGKTIMQGISELRIKESDRINAISQGLQKISVRCEQKNDKLVIVGANIGQENIKLEQKNINIKAHGDHRIAMSFITLGLALGLASTAGDAKHKTSQKITQKITKKITKKITQRITQRITVDSAEAIATSFPDFIQRMQKIGANLTKL